MPASNLLEFIDPSNSLISPNLLHLYSAVEQLSPEERKSLSGFMRSIDAPKPVDGRGLVRNSRGLTISDRKSILYLGEFAFPRAGRDELSAIFGVSRQRVSQITGANGHSRADAGLLEQFRRASPSELRDRWRVEAHVEQLRQFRAGRVAAAPLF